LYTDADVAMVRRLKQLRENGLAASEAARVVLRERSTTSGSTHSPSDAVERLVDAASRMDGVAIDQQLAAALGHGHPAEAFDGLVAPVMVAIGEAWEAGTLSEAQEHFLSEHVIFALQQWLILARPTTNLGSAIIACYAHELHTIPAYGLALKWELKGFVPVMLGARTTPNALRVAIEHLRPRVVGLSLTMPASREQSEMLAAYAAACRPLPWVLGGAGTSSLADAVTAHGGLCWPADPPSQAIVLERIARGVR
jgi:methanogenic corrinoid protein MtbC1